MKKVLLLLPNGFETSEASAFIDVIGWNFLDGDNTTGLYTCGITKEVLTTFGQRMIVDFTIDEISTSEYDALAIPGGFEEFNYYKDGYDERILEIVREFDAEKKPIATICVASLILGKSGILKGKKATTYNKRGGLRQKTLAEFGAVVVNEPVVIDGNVISSWNPSTAMTVALELLEKLTNKKNADFIREIMGF